MKRFWILTRNFRAKENVRKNRIASAAGIQIANRNFHEFSTHTSQMWLSMASVLMRHEPPTRRR